MIEIDDRGATLAGLSHENPAVRRGALVALDQMNHGQLTRELVAPLLASDDVALAKTLVGILAKHPDWHESMLEAVVDWLAEPSPSDDKVSLARGAVSAFLGEPRVQQVVLRSLTSSETAKPMRLALLEAIAGGEYAQPPTHWNAALDETLASPDADVVRQAIATISRLDAAPFVARLLAIGLQPNREDELRLAALRAASKIRPPGSEATFAYLVSQLQGERPLRERLLAAEALGGLALSATQREQTARLLSHCQALEVSWLLHAFDGDSNAATGRLVIESLKASPALASLSADRLRPHLASYPDEVRQAGEALFAERESNEASRAEKLKSLESVLDGGSAARGEEVFFGQRSACSACHRVGTRGERIGPELTKIGEIRTRRDLLEAVVIPSASLARGYETFHAVTKDGNVYTGLLSRETAAAIYLRTAERAEVRVPRSELEQLSPHATSIMPEGLEKLLGPGELADVIAYLQSLK